MSPWSRLLRPLHVAFDVGRDTYLAWHEDRAIRLGAGLAYYGLFAIVPLISLSLLVAGVVFSDQDIEEFLDETLGNVLETDVTELSASLTEELHTGRSRSGLGLIGIGSLVVAASFVFVALEDAFAVIWHVPVRRGWRFTVRRRLLAFMVVLVTGLVVVAALSVHTVAGLAEALLPGEIPVVEHTADLVGAAGLWVITSAVIVVLFELLVSTRVPWRPAVIGAGITAALLGLGTWAVGLYLGHFGASSVSGAAGGVLLVLVWIYYEAQILLVGAELTKVMSFRQSNSAGQDDDQPTGQS